MSENVRVRFAPSPTGKLHIGGARTAIFNWAFARAHKGSFILRIEDTDPERSTKENVDVILNAMRWLGLDYDEGPGKESSYGPYFQMQRMETYAEALETLKEKGLAYPCFCTKEELDEKRTIAEKEQGGYSGYDRTCRDLPKDEVDRKLAAGVPHTWRLKVPLDHPDIVFDDAVYGKVSFPADVMDDLILVRSDGSPTYNFAVVCDDVNMAITHVIRGDDHLSNTPRQILIYEALDKPIPTFAHLSMILGLDGKKLSKRHGAASVEEYRDMGYLSDAVVNFLALLGWSLDGETTIMSRDLICSEFDLDRITKKDAIFDEVKLEWMNGIYIRELDAASWVDVSHPWLVRAMAEGFSVQQGVNVIPNNLDVGEKVCPYDEAVFESRCARAEKEALAKKEWFGKLYPLVIERLNHLDEIPDKLRFLFWGPHCLLDEKSLKKVLLKENARPLEALRACRDILADTSYPWEAKPLENACRELAEPLDMKLRNLFQPVRVAVCGNMVSPPLFESIELMERADVVARIDAVISFVEQYQ